MYLERHDTGQEEEYIGTRREIEGMSSQMRDWSIHENRRLIARDAIKGTLGCE